MTKIKVAKGRFVESPLVWSILDNRRKPMRVEGPGGVAYILGEDGKWRRVEDEFQRDSLNTSKLRQSIADSIQTQDQRMIQARRELRDFSAFLSHRRIVKNSLIVVGLLLLTGAVITEGVQLPSVVTTTNVQPLTSQSVGLLVRPIGTQTSTLQTTWYSTSSRGSYPTCPHGGRYYSSICTKLCGCQYDICVTFDYNCANDYKAVYIGGVTVVSTYISTYTPTSIGLTSYSTTSTYCTTAMSQAIISNTQVGMRSELTPIMWALAVSGVFALVLEAFLRLKSRRLK